MLCYSCSLWPPTLQWVHHFTFHPFSSPHPLRASAHSLTHLYIYHALYSVIKMFNMRSHGQTKMATATDVLQITSGNPVIFDIGPRILDAVIINDNPFSNLFFISHNLFFISPLPRRPQMTLFTPNSQYGGRWPTAVAPFCTPRPLWS